MYHVRSFCSIPIDFARPLFRPCREPGTIAISNVRLFPEARRSRNEGVPLDSSDWFSMPLWPSKKIFACNTSQQQKKVVAFGGRLLRQSRCLSHTMFLKVQTERRYRLAYLRQHIRLEVLLCIQIPQTDLSVGVLTVLVLLALVQFLLRWWWSRSIFYCNWSTWWHYCTIKSLPLVKLKN